MSSVIAPGFSIGHMLGLAALCDGWPAAALLDERAAARVVSAYDIDALIAAAKRGDAHVWIASVGEGLRAVGLRALGSGWGRS